MTFSLVARCPKTGQLGIAVATAVGGLCPYVRAGVGAVTTQSWVNPSLDRMAARESAPSAAGAVAPEVSVMLPIPPPCRPGGGGGHG